MHRSICPNPGERIPDAANGDRPRVLADVRIAEGERAGASMAGLVEEARWRVSARGRRYMMVTLSDSSGQYVATAFDDDATAALEQAAKVGSCGLMAVELDRRADDETPRVTIKRFQPLEALAKRTRLQMTISVPSEAAITRIALELEGARGGNGTLRFRLPLANGGEAVILAGRDFVLDAEIAARVERIAGEGSVDLSVQEPPKLALVG